MNINDILNKHIQELIFEVMCCIDMYKQNKVINANIDCWFITPNMMLCNDSENIKKTLFERVKYLFKTNNIDIIESKGLYLFKGRMTLSVEIVDKDLKKQISEKNDERIRLLKDSNLKYYSSNENENYYYNDGHVYCFDVSYYENYENKNLERFETKPLNPLKQLDIHLKIINDDIVREKEKNKSFFRKWF